MLKISRVEVEQIMDKKLPYEKLFNKTKETFGAVHAAERFCKLHGLNYGSMESGNPIAVARVPVMGKWTRFEAYEYPQMDGVLLSEDFRDGSVALFLSYDPTKVAKIV